jgi:hypothetical protein
VGAVVCGVLLTLYCPGALAATWGTGVEAGLPANAAANPYADPESVACAAPGNCTAVGYYFDTSGNEQGLPLSETTGTCGAGITAPLPANAGADRLAEVHMVSCPSTESCAAVGDYRDGPGNEHGLLLTDSSGT